jgi:hypothetical protein
MVRWSKRLWWIQKKRNYSLNNFVKYDESGWTSWFMWMGLWVMNSGGNGPER